MSGECVGHFSALIRSGSTFRGGPELPWLDVMLLTEYGTHQTNTIYISSIPGQFVLITINSWDHEWCHWNLQV